MNVIHRFGFTKAEFFFRGDCAKDEMGAYAIYEEMSASPTAVHSANANLAYGLLPGHKSTQADAVRAYIQSVLKGRETWVQVPRELWPPEWHTRGFQKPMCLLYKSLYGHPDSGGYWERHLTKALEKLGGIPVEGHSSSFWFEKRELLLTVYVDDLLLSGPEGQHTRFWNDLRAGPEGIKIEDPEPLGRFLGRQHLVSDVPFEPSPQLQKPADGKSE